MAKPQHCLSKTQGALTALSLAFSLSACAPPTNVDATTSVYAKPVQQLVEASGVQIGFDNFNFTNEDDHYSVLGSEDENTSLHLPMQVAVLHEISKHPETLKKLIKSVHLVETIRVSGQMDEATSIAGIYSAQSGLVMLESISILESERDRPPSPDHLNQVNFSHLCPLFHHEASSLLIHGAKGNVLDAWVKAFPPEKFIRVIRYNSFGDDYEYDPELPSGGFLRVYGATAPENDINTHFEFLFCHQEWYAQLILGHPVIAQKYQLIKKWLLEVDPEYKKVFKPVDRYIERGKEWGWQDYTDRNLFP